MQHKIIIEKGGQVTHDVVGGVGPSCREKSLPYLDAIRDQFGLPGSAVNEDCKPEMQQTEAQAETLEGDKLV